MIIVVFGIPLAVIILLVALFISLNTLGVDTSTREKVIGTVIDFEIYPGGFLRNDTCKVETENGYSLQQEPVCGKLETGKELFVRKTIWGESHLLRETSK
jgi:hypothetical protein